MGAWDYDESGEIKMKLDKIIELLEKIIDDKKFQF